MWCVLDWCVLDKRKRAAEYPLIFPVVAAFLVLVLSAMVCPAGVVVTENVSPGATSWPGSPLISTLANPSTTSVIESFNGGGGNTNLSETFTITAANYTLQTISLYAGAGSGTGPGTNLVLKLYDLGSQTAPNPSPYTPAILGSDLLGAGAGLSVSYVSQATGILQFDFTGSDQVTLINGHLYAFEVTGTINTTPVFWSRGVSDTYAGGAAYRNQGWINGSNARDFALAVYATAVNDNTNANTNTFPVPYGIAYHVFTSPNNGLNQDGANPAGGLRLSGGLLYGTTMNGGAQGAGTVFALAPDASAFTTVRSFANAPDGANPQADLLAAGGNFFGTTLAGGNNGVGTIFLGGTNGIFSNGNYSLLRSFAVVSADEATNAGGASPNASLVLAGSTLFGTTSAGGAAACGTVFSSATNGLGFSVLHDFSAPDTVTGTNTDGALPGGGLVLSGNILYGTAAAGGAGGAGVIFSINTSGGGFTTLHNFRALDPLAATNQDGAFPGSDLVLSNGTLYGTALAGGTGGKGTVFSIGTNGLGFTVLHDFSGIDPVTRTNVDGALPCAALALSGGTLYGVAAAGGVGGEGTVFAVSTNGTQFQTLHTFTALDAVTGTNNDGAQPVAGLLSLGNALYGTTFSGGPGAAGTVFKLTIPFPPAMITNIVCAPDGSVVLYFLGGSSSTNIVQASDGLAPPVTWHNVSTNIADAGGAWQFVDTNATQPMQFYRSYAP